MRLVRWLIAIVLVAGLCWKFPPFRIVSLSKVAEEKAAAVFNAKQFSEAFWSGSLLPALDKAADASELLSSIQNDPVTAKKKFSQSIGLSEGYFYFLRGKGKVISVSEDEVSINLTGGTDAQISLQTGLIFGSALRDGTGLLNANDYPNSQDFNAIAEALNHIAETQVQPKLRAQAKVGANISFAGCAEVSDETTDLKTLKVIPIQTETE